MKKILLLLLVFSCFAIFADSDVNLLKQQLQTAVGAQKIQILQQLADEYSKNKNYEEAIKYRSMMINEYKANYSPASEIDSLQHIINLLEIRVAETKQAEVYLDKALEDYSDIQILSEKKLEYLSIINKPEFLEKANYILSNLNKSFALFEKYDDTLKMITCLNHLGVLYQLKDTGDAALKYFTKQYNLAVDIKDINTEAKSLANIGFYYQAENINNSALSNYFKSVEKYKQIDSIEKIIEINRNIAKIYKKQRNFSSQIACLAENVKLAVNLKDTLSIINCHKELSKGYEPLPDSIDKAIAILDRVKNRYILPKYGNDSNYARLQLQLGNLYIQKGITTKKTENYKIALPLLLEADSIFIASTGEGSYDYINSRYSLAFLHYNINSNELAAKYYNDAVKSMSTQLETNNISSIDKVVEFLQRDKQLDEITALIRQKDIENKNLIINNQKLVIDKQKLELSATVQKLKIKDLEISKNRLERDSLLKNNKIKDLELESAQNEKALINSELENEQKEGDLQRMLALILILFIVMFFIAYAFISKRKTAKILEQKNTQLLDSNTKLSISESNLLESNQKILADLEVASKHIISLLPPMITKGDVKTKWKFVPSAELGGDSFGCHWLDDEHFSVYLLDVCGHGVGAALHSVSALNIIRLQTLPNTDFRQPEQVLAGLNQTFQMSEHNEMYFTIWYGVFNKKTRELNFASGGHPPSLLINEKGELVPLDTPNFIIGGLPFFEFTSQKIKIEKDSYLYIFSDGVYEIRLENEKYWELHDLFQFLQANYKSGDEIEQLYQLAQKMRGSTQLDDDFSMIRIEFD